MLQEHYKSAVRVSAAEQRAEIRDQRSECREQRAESREQRAESRERTLFPVSAVRHAGVVAEVLRRVLAERRVLVLERF
jgi:hypothetical protein